MRKGQSAHQYMDLIIIAKQLYGIGQAELIVLSKLPDGGSTVHKLHQLKEAGFNEFHFLWAHRGIYYLMDEYSLFLFGLD